MYVHGVYVYIYICICMLMSMVCYYRRYYQYLPVGATNAARTAAYYFLLQ